MCYLGSNPATPVSTKNKKLCHVPDSLIARDFRPSLHQYQASQLAFHPDKKRVPARVAPIKRKVPIAEPSIRSDLYIVEFAEVVRIQLKQISQDRLLFRSGGNDLDMHGCLHCASHHSRRQVLRATNLASAKRHFPLKHERLGARADPYNIRTPSFVYTGR